MGHGHGAWACVHRRAPPAGTAGSQILLTHLLTCLLTYLLTYLLTDEPRQLGLLEARSQPEPVLLGVEISLVARLPSLVGLGEGEGREVRGEG